MRKRYMEIFGIIVCTLLLVGCRGAEETKVTGTGLYYVNAKGNSLVKESYKLKGDSAKEQVKNSLADLQKERKEEEVKSPFPKGVKVESWVLENEKLNIYFNQEYSSMDANQEVLLRASVVQTLVQAAGVEYVQFFVGGEPLADDMGMPRGYMRAEDFVQNTGYSLHSYQIANLKLYYANKKGDKLVAEEVSVRYNSNMSVEKLIVEQLIKGPKDKEHQPVIPTGTKLLGVSVRDGICYVNFDEGFYGSEYTINPKLAVYSLVNSIVEGGMASQVQISINGENDVKYQGSVDLSKPLFTDVTMVEEAQE